MWGAAPWIGIIMRLLYSVLFSVAKLFLAGLRSSHTHIQKKSKARDDAIEFRCLTLKFDLIAVDIASIQVGRRARMDILFVIGMKF